MQTFKTYAMSRNLVSIFALCVLLLNPAFTHAMRPLRVIVDPVKSYQTIDGFGASDAWRCQHVGKNWPLAKREAIADLLFSREFDAQGHPRGIGLSLWRFYLCAGTAEQGEASGIKNPWRRGECFVDANGHYDWSKHAGQQWFLNAAKERGVGRLLAFSIAAPVFWSKNGKGYATKGDWSYNIASDRYDDYARYLVDVIEHFEERDIHFDYLSPFNEPQWDWSSPGQEGSPANNEELVRFTRLLAGELSQRGLTTQLVLGEAGQLSFVYGPNNRRPDCSDQVRVFFSPDSRLYVGALPNVLNAISYHSYYSVWPVGILQEERQKLADTVTTVDPNLGVWQSEYCILGKNDEVGQGWGRDLGMDTALYVARIIHCDLTVAQARSWQWWTALTQYDYKDGLIYLDDGRSNGVRQGDGAQSLSLMEDGEFKPSKLLWALGNYSRFVRPGMIRIACHVSPRQDLKSRLLASAYMEPDEERTVIILTNQAQSERRVDLNDAEGYRQYVTSNTRDLHDTPVAGDMIILEPRSITTLVRYREQQP